MNARNGTRFDNLLSLRHCLSSAVKRIVTYWHKPKKTSPSSMIDHQEQVKPKTPRSPHINTVSVGQDVVKTQVSNSPQQYKEAEEEDEFSYDKNYKDLLAHLPHDAFSSTNSFEHFLVGLGVTQYIAIPTSSTLPHFELNWLFSAISKHQTSRTTYKSSTDHAVWDSGSSSSASNAVVKKAQLANSEQRVISNISQT